MKQNSKIKIILSVILIAILGLLSGCNRLGDGDKVFHMRYATISASTDPQSIAGRHLQQLLEEQTDGKIELTIYENSQLASSDREKAEMVQMGIIEMCSVPSSALAALSSDLNKFFIYDYPYLFRSNEEILAFNESELGQELFAEVADAVGIQSVGAFKLGWLIISNESRPLKDPSDFSGLKIRTMSSDLMMDFIKGAGGSATPLSYGEVYTALQQKTIDGLMTSTGLFVTDGFYEVQSYLCPTQQSANVHIVLINEKWYNSLPDDLKVIFDECIQEYIDVARVEYDKNEEESLEYMQEQGLELTEISDIDAFYEIGEQVMQDNADIVGEDYLNRVIDWLKEYRANYS